MTKILIVDDSETIRIQLKTDLNSGDNNYDIIEAHDGLNGLEVLNANKDVRLIICDVNMPEMDGLTMCEEIHKDDALNSIPIIMLTTQCSADMKARGKENGVIAWITKPHKPKMLLGGIKKILSRP
ncbi:MAG: response regulator [Gammaproteobacteria bacterium]|nr:response regulator [Gammaproteobacteria bacterium]